jgi:hypothetical protein
LKTIEPDRTGLPPQKALLILARFDVSRRLPHHAPKENSEV